MGSAIMSLINTDFVDFVDMFRYLIPRSGVKFPCRKLPKSLPGGIWSADLEIESDPGGIWSSDLEIESDPGGIWSADLEIESDLGKSDF